MPLLDNSGTSFDTLRIFIERISNSFLFDTYVTYIQVDDEVLIVLVEDYIFHEKINIKFLLIHTHSLFT